MIKKYLKNAALIVSAISAMFLVYEFFSMCLNATVAVDMDDFTNSAYARWILKYIKGDSIALAFLLAFTLMCDIFGIFGKKRYFAVLPAALNAALALICFIFAGVIRAKAVDFAAADAYTAASAYVLELVQVAISALVVSAVFLAESLSRERRGQKTAQPAEAQPAKAQPAAQDAEEQNAVPENNPDAEEQGVVAESKQPDVRCAEEEGSVSEAVTEVGNEAEN